MTLKTVGGGAFSAAVREFAEKTKKNKDKVIRGTCLQLSGMVIKRTPVGDPSLWKSKPPVGYVGGTARGNWLASVEKPVTKMDKSSAWGRGGAKNVYAKLDAAAGNASGHVFYLTNNVPYILRLEYEGHSSQAPAGMARISITEFHKAIQEQINKL